jgi:hypothetical protein
VGLSQAFDPTPPPPGKLGTNIIEEIKKTNYILITTI